MNKDIHVLTAILANLLVIIILFSTDNPIIVLSLFFFCIIIFSFTGNLMKLKKGFIYFIPFSIMTIIVNMIFVQQGNTVLFTIFSRNFTLESLIYALILSLKLLIIMYIFICFSIMIDSDKALSYFSSIIPKCTLTLMIALKLFPSMKERIKTLKEIYIIRGVDFQSKTLKEKIKAYIPIFSILLEDSLEESFDIGESAFVRGFLSGKRSVYERDKFKIKDYFLIFLCSVILVLSMYFLIKGYMKFNIYVLQDLKMALNIASLIISFLILSLSLIIAA